MKTGIQLIAQERKEQIEKHGRTVEGDMLLNRNDELTTAARALLSNSTPRTRFSHMPVSWNDDVCIKMSKKAYKERLIIAGALIAAEIDRLQHAEEECQMILSFSTHWPKKMGELAGK